MQRLSAAANAGRVSLRSVLRTRLLFGYYCPLGAGVATRTLAWIYCFCFASVLIALLVTGFVEEGIPLEIFYAVLIEYSCNVLISLITGDKHIFNYLKGIELIDREMGYDLPLTTPAIELVYLIMCVEKVMAWVGGVFILNKHLSKSSIMTMIILAAMNQNYLIIVLPLDLLRLRLRLVRQSLEINLIQHSSNLNNTNDQIKMLLDSLRLYKKLIDNFNHTFNWAKLRIIIGLTCCAHGFLSVGYGILKSIITKNLIGSFGSGMIGMATRTLETFFNVTFTCLPVVFSELVNREYEELKTAVGSLLLLCEDSSLQRELEMAAEYLELRPFKVTILRVLVLDGSLLLTFAGLCVSYLIVLIQITGLI